MKKLIFGCCLMLSGILGASAWLVAVSNLMVAEGWYTMLNIFLSVRFGRADGYIVILFYMLAVVGAVIAIKGIKDNK